MSALTQMDLDCMVGNILAHQTLVTDYWEQEWVCVGTFTFFSVYFVLFEFWARRIHLYITYVVIKKKSSLKNTRETRFRSWKPPPFKMPRKLHLSWQIDCMKDINQKGRKETLRKQEKNQKSYQFMK